MDPREAARELGVRYVIRGSVERDGERVHLALTLVDGESGAQRWSQRLEVERSRLKSSIEDLNGGVARALTIEVGRSVGELAAKIQPHEVAADNLATRGFAVFMRGLRLRARHPEFETSTIPALWNGKHPSFIEGRNLLVATVRNLGLP